MARTKYREYLEKMLSENKEIFDRFRKVHNEYSVKPDTLQQQFNEVGEKILEIVREYENRLCANTERGMYNKYSTGLAEKFQQEIRKFFPLIDHVGLIVQKPKDLIESTFSLKKIKLN